MAKRSEHRAVHVPSMGRAAIRLRRSTRAASLSSLKPRSERKLTPEQIIEELRPKLDGGSRHPRLSAQSASGAHRRQPEPQPVSVHACRRPISNMLYSSAAAFEKRMRTLPGLADVNSDLQISSPTLNVDIDRDRASALGVTEEQIENALYDAYGAAPGLHHLHADRQLLGDHGSCCRSTSAILTAWGCSTSAPPTGIWCR